MAAAMPINTGDGGKLLRRPKHSYTTVSPHRPKSGQRQTALRFYNMKQNPEELHFQLT